MTNEIYFGDSFDPYRNLAVEEALFLRAQTGVTLYLWQNENTVVIGKNQCAYTECRLTALDADGGKLARRTSGGGAVFHDLGNLNYTFVADKAHYDVKKQLSVILKALAGFGLAAEASGRNDLTLLPGGEKFSGSAFRVGKEAGFQHGTLLVNVDMDKLARYLAPPPEKYRTKGVQSVRARVKNLAECCPRITVDSMKAALADAFASVYGAAEACDISALDAGLIAQLAARNASDEWRLGKVPKYDAALSHRFSFGRIDFQFQLDGGFIRACAAYSDAMDPSLPEALSGHLTGCAFAPEALAANVRSLPFAEAMEIADWLAARA